MKKHIFPGKKRCGRMPKNVIRALNDAIPLATAGGVVIKLPEIMSDARDAIQKLMGQVNFLEGKLACLEIQKERAEAKMEKIISVIDGVCEV